MSTELGETESALDCTLTVQLTRFAGPGKLVDEGLSRRCYQITTREGFVRLTLADLDWLRRQLDEHEPQLDDVRDDVWDAAKLRQELDRSKAALEAANAAITETSARYALLLPLLTRALQLQYGPEDWRMEISAAIAVQTSLADHVANLEALLAVGQNIVRPLTGGDAGCRRWLEQVQAALRDPVGHARRFRIHDVAETPSQVRITTLAGKHVAVVARELLNEKLLELMEAP